MIDTAKIKIKAGNGGDGIISFRREKYISKGGPWGGDGGTGGDIIFKIDKHANTLTKFKRKRKFDAENGKPGMRKLKKGKDGENLVIKVPIGTVIKDKNNKILFDFTNTSQEFVIAKGGKGGLGNWHFKSSVNRTPMIATPGEHTKQIELQLELKLLADVGLIGLPSSGKSTLLNALTQTNVKTAEYHFTTLEPNLGVLFVNKYIPNNDVEIILADIPGLIEGAADGKGLGHDFLRHIERTKVLVHILDGSKILTQNLQVLLDDFHIINEELQKWNKDLTEKPQIVVVNKIDLSEVKTKIPLIKKIFAQENITPIFISAATNENLENLVSEIVKSLETEKQKEQTKLSKNEEKNQLVEFNINNLPNKRIVFRNQRPKITTVGPNK